MAAEALCAQPLPSETAGVDNYVSGTQRYLAPWHRHLRIPQVKSLEVTPAETDEAVSDSEDEAPTGLDRASVSGAERWQAQRWLTMEHLMTLRRNIKAKRLAWKADGTASPGGVAAGPRALQVHVALRRRLPQQQQRRTR